MTSTNAHLPADELEAFDLYAGRPAEVRAAGYAQAERVVAQRRAAGLPVDGRVEQAPVAPSTSSTWVQGITAAALVGFLVMTRDLTFDSADGVATVLRLLALVAVAALVAPMLRPGRTS